MVIEITMPQMGESLTEGTVTNWFKAVGDQVEKDEAVVEIETDKVNTEVEAVGGGTLTEILVLEGQTVAVGTVLARLDSDVSTEAEPAGPSSAAPTESGVHFGGTGDADILDFGSDTESRDVKHGGDDSATATKRNRKLSPVVLSLAERHGIARDTLENIPGSGAGGRLTKQDLEGWISESKADTVEKPAAAEASVMSPEKETPAQYVYSPTPRDTRTRMSPTRRNISDHMKWSQRIAAAATTVDEMDVSSLVDMVARESNDFQERLGIKLTYTHVIGYAIVKTLLEFPTLNSAIVDDEIIERPYIHLGLAVATKGGQELVVPVIYDADQLDFNTFVRRMDDVAARAAVGRLETREMKDGTFTYSNPGMAGGLYGTPIINQPQVAILSTHAIRKTPWVANDTVVVRPVMGISMTFDHRVVDGLVGYQFLTRFIQILSDANELTGTART